jgi:hypothetical protein
MVTPARSSAVLWFLHASFELPLCWHGASTADPQADPKPASDAVPPRLTAFWPRGKRSDLGKRVATCCGVTKGEQPAVVNAHALHVLGKDDPHQRMRVRLRVWVKKPGDQQRLVFPGAWSLNAAIGLNSRSGGLASGLCLLTSVNRVNRLPTLHVRVVGNQRGLGRPTFSPLGPPAAVLGSGLV